MKSCDFRKEIGDTLSNLDDTISDLKKGYDEMLDIYRMAYTGKEKQ